MENLGSLAVLLALCLAIYAVAASLVGAASQRVLLILSARRAVYANWFLLSLAVASLLGVLLGDDFRWAYVAENSNRAMPLLYKFTAWWGGQEGSLLLWSWVLAGYAVLATKPGRRPAPALPYVIALLMAGECFFLILNAFVASPFKLLAVGRSVTAVADGRGLNPLLQYWAMAIHPPVLYLGYAGFAVPFAVAAAALITRAPAGEWTRVAQRWMRIVWLFQGAGIALGAVWAYAVLGWGGYWGWDPVENASLLPWLTATAFLHSVTVQQARGMLKVWNVVLVAASFWLSVLGTFLTRSGVVSSVHAFGQSPVGGWFAGFLGLGLAATAYLILSRLDYLGSSARPASVFSREGLFLLNNLLLTAMCLAILLGTLFPLLFELVSGHKISLGPQFYNRMAVPLGLLLLLLTAIGPLAGWGSSSLTVFKRSLLPAAVAAVGLVAVLAAAGIRHGYALIAFGLCWLAISSIVAEFLKAARLVRAQTGASCLGAVVACVRRHPHRYGGYLVHLGIALMFVGFAGSALNKQGAYQMALGDRVTLGSYELRLHQLKQGENDNYAWQRAVVEVYRNGRHRGTLQPERRFFKASGQVTSEVDIRQSLIEDLYLNLAATSEANQEVMIQAYVFPLVSWIWLGMAVMGVGGLICLKPGQVTEGKRSSEAGIRAARCVGAH